MTRLVFALFFMMANFGFAAPFGLVVHGGAGGCTPLNEQQQADYRSAIEHALERGYAILESGGSALDAVEAAVVDLEDCPFFNAAKGAAFNAKGEIELEASIMEGDSKQAGAVAGLRHVKNPILLAKAVMEHSKHVMLIGQGAEEFAKEQGITLVDPSEFFVQARWEKYLKKQSKDEYGTVGAVALDQSGKIAAGTSTGGIAYKLPGRVGDSAILGAGTYADSCCGISCTGRGEGFMRLVAAHTVAMLMEYKGYTLQKAADEVIMHKLCHMRYKGGLIGLDKKGNVVMPFNCARMYRGYKMSDRPTHVALYKE